MQIDRHIDAYTIPEETPIAEALKKLNENKQKILFVINPYNVITGAMSDGDFRRWILSGNSLDLSTPVGSVANKVFVSASEESDDSEISELFSERISIVPVVDEENRIKAVVRPGNKLFSIGGFNLNESARALIIAEIGNNHNGSVDEAKRLIDSAIESGADCVKFQMRDIDSLYVNQGNSDDPTADLGTQYVLDLLSRFQLTDDRFKEVFDYCQDKGIARLCTPFDIVSADKLEAIGVEAYKVASADLTNHDLITHLCKKNKPLIISTGMSTEEEIISTISLLKSLNANYVLLHCNSTYPAPFEDVNLNYLGRLKTLSSNIVGYSGHERGFGVAVASVALGAKIVEKHFTLDRSQEGNDHKVSLLPDEFKEMVQRIREVEKALGNSETRKITQGEMINRESLGKSVIAKIPIKKGEVIHESMLAVMSPGKGLAPCYKKDLIGRVAKRDIQKHQFFFMSDLSLETVKPRPYQFKNRYGLPVRYHDFEKIVANTNLNFVEFHLSYKDLNFDIEKKFKGKDYGVDCLIHSPELFSGDHLLDLCSEDEEYRQQSLKEVRRVIEISNKVKRYFFNKNNRVLIVVNVGGFSQKGFLSIEEKNLKLEMLAKSISELDRDGVELIPQTMPPYPWHFGGQQFHNIFVDPEQIVSWCEKYGMRICFDLSHTALACNFLNIDLMETVEKLSPYTAHLHIADASGTKQEGLQIGEGDIDFYQIFKIMESKMPTAYWLPEIWQGHKNDGEGFWLALNRLEKASMR